MWSPPIMCEVVLRLDHFHLIHLPLGDVEDDGSWRCPDTVWPQQYQVNNLVTTSCCKQQETILTTCHCHRAAPAQAPRKVFCTDSLCLVVWHYNHLHGMLLNAGLLFSFTVLFNLKTIAILESRMSWSLHSILFLGLTSNLNMKGYICLFKKWEVIEIVFSHLVLGQ